MTSTIFGAEDNGRTVSVTTQTVFSIELEENPTTGYRWSVPQFDGKYLELESDQFSPATGTGVGGGGIRQFSFRVKTPGKSNVRLVRARSWEKDSQGPEFEITVIGT